VSREDASCTSSYLGSTFAFFSRCVCSISFFSSLLIVVSAKRLTSFHIPLICRTFDENTSFESLAIVITLPLIEYESNDISLIYYTFDDDTLKNSTTIDGTFFNDLMILLSLIEYESNDISLICHTFDDDTLKNSTIVISLSSLVYETNDESIVFNN